MRRAHRVDGPQAEVIRVLRSVGASVVDLSAVGSGCPDLLVSFGGTTVLMEVKSRDGSLQKNQKKFIRGWSGHYVVVRSSEDALKWVQSIFIRVGAM